MHISEWGTSVLRLPGDSLNDMPDDSHEAAVKAFMAEAQANDPERFALVCGQHRVLSGHQLARRSSRELPLSPTYSDDRLPRRNGNLKRRPGKRSAEFWAAYYSFEMERS